MKYLGKLFLSLREIFILMTLQYAILIVCVLTIGVDESVIWGSILLCIFQIVYILWKSKKSKFRISNGSYFPYLLLGIGVATTYNMIIFKMGLGEDVNTDFPIILNIICSGIIGPIFEEILFRYDFIRRLEKFNTNNWIIIILSGIIFGLFHTGIVTMVYGAIVGIINSYIYIRDKDIMKPIMVHMAGNIFVNLLFGYNTLVLILGVILTILGLLMIRNND